MTYFGENRYRVRPGNPGYYELFDTEKDEVVLTTANRERAWREKSHREETNARAKRKERADA